MKTINKIYIVLFTLSLFACGGGGGGSSTPAPVQPPPNTAPVANAGSNQTVVTGALVTLDGSNSSDANGDTITYQWSFSGVPFGSNATLQNATSETASFTADIDGTYTIELIVNDGQANSNVANVTITAETPNIAPVANAGTNQIVDTLSTVILDGSLSTDENGDSLTYSWSIVSAPVNSVALIDEPSVVMPDFVPDLDGDYVIQLIVNDGLADSAPVNITITAETPNEAPIADAGPNQNVNTGDIVTLNGTNSTDVDGDSITYSWSITSVPNGSLASLSDTTLAMPEFTADIEGQYIIELVVNDGQIDSQSDSVTIEATTLNAAPVAQAGENQNVATGTLVTLDGSASTDADGDELSYAWTLTTILINSNATFDDATLASPSFTVDVDGTYIATLIVNDGTESSEPDSVIITATTANSKPTANAGIDQNVNIDTLVTLDASNSSDPDGDNLTYRWSFTSIPNNSTSVLSSADTASPSFTPDLEGVYTAQLIVNDGKINSNADTVNIIASVVNSAPVANAGEDQRTTTSTLVTLDGSASTDANNDALSYSWAFVSRPMGSNAVLSNAQTVSPSFTTDLEGSYVLSLVVSDGIESSATDTVQVVVSDTVVQLVRNVGSREVDFDPVPFPYITSGSLNVNISADPLPETFTLNTFKITPLGGNLTVTNIVVINSTNDLEPSLTGLSEGQVLTDGVEATFRLISPLTSGETIDLLFSFEIAETGDTFVAEYKFTSN